MPGRGAKTQEGRSTESEDRPCAQVITSMAGDAVDQFIASQLRELQREHAVSRALRHIESALWPGGTWFMTAVSLHRLHEPFGHSTGV